MYKVFIYLLVLFLVLVQLTKAQQPSDDELYSVFENWMVAYEITIPADQLSDRFKIFKDNVVIVAGLNSNHTEEVIDIELLYPAESLSESKRSLLAIEEAEPTISYPSMDQPSYSLNEYSQMTTEEFLASNTGFDGSEFIPVAAAAGLAASTIGAIAAGSVFVAGTTVATVIVVKKHLNKKKKDAAEQTSEIEMEEAPRERRKTLIDIFRFHPKNSHQSITARTPATTSS
ncbi:hypothetical protein DFA_06730 [Cavenderia fasciculata]|uniref:Cathepsin propeptide inhibitor domain-containing protein n=1 Tax=Cavenderia fasciculata TaxID=261658 RepID=F4Q243_CACFS|nr:uncharacterized protein DFA_06730 [Cavenderia fasciculata]EGG18063.1 hypothetical protein DFA_06730 [Cavenderia fasciculata]|eukprot:XP_004356956.1 hypothetical protein DFA_06730 [Cavenderia fasciculata]